MLNKKPRVVIFFGGQADNHDLSTQTGYYVCQYVPRDRYDVTPVEITAEGAWKVPLGSLPRAGSVERVLDNLRQAVPAVSPTQGLARLAQKPMAGIMTLTRGRGGDDGALHSLAEVLQVPVIGSSASASRITADKQLTGQALEDIALSPISLGASANEEAEEIMERVRAHTPLPLFVKPVAAEGSVGVARAESVEDLRAALQKGRGLGSLLIQPQEAGVETAVTLWQDERGHTHALPPTIVSPHKATFYDHLAKRIPGRVTIDSRSISDDMRTAALETAYNVFEGLGLAGVATIDMVIDDGIPVVLDVNTVPTISAYSPLRQQLAASGLHPTRFVDALIRRVVG